jgi:hypothetical protein
MTITPLTPTSGDTEVTLTAKILVLLAGGGGTGLPLVALSSGTGPPTFTPTNCTLAQYQDTNTGIIYVWNNVNGWYPTA